MSQATPNYDLYLEDDGTTKFEEWRKKINGPNNSNMVKIDNALAAKINKVANATAGNIATLTSEGDVQDSGKKAGGGTLAAIPSADTLATEGAVSTALATKQDKLTGQPGQVVGFSTDGNVAVVQGWSNLNLLDNWHSST